MRFIPTSKKIGKNEKMAWSKDFHNKLKDVFIKNDMISTLPEKDNPNFPYLYPYYKNEGARGYYQNEHDGWELGPITRKHFESLPNSKKPQLIERCWYCQNIIKMRSKSPHTKKFCNTYHQKAYDKIKNQDLKKLKSELIYWSNNKKNNDIHSEYVIPERKDMIVKFVDGTTKPLTTKKGKRRN